MWSTLPATALARMAVPPPPADALAAASALEYRAMALVYLVLPRRRYTPFDAHYLPDGATPVTRVSEPRNYRDGPDPEGVTVLCAEIPCDAAGGLFAAPDEVLGEVAAEGLAEAAYRAPRSPASRWPACATPTPCCAPASSAISPRSTRGPTRSPPC